MIRLPILRAGAAYESIDAVQLDDVRTGAPVARVSQANSGMVSRDLLGAAEQRRALGRLPVADLLTICREAADLFVDAELPVDPISGRTQSPEEYVLSLSATTGMPQALCRANMNKIRTVLADMERVLGGLTRGIDLKVLDEGLVEQDGRDLSYVSLTDMLGVVLPSNSPGVHSLWLPSIALKVPLALKPGGREPWTPMRAIQALIRAGCPAEAFGFYPTDYAGATQLMLRSGRSMIFGDHSTVERWSNDARVQVHGPGWSKVLLGADASPRWERYLDVMEASVASNGGRSCLNASGIWMASHAREAAEALARKMNGLEALPLDDPRAGLAAFSQPEIARRISEMIDDHLKTPGAEDVSAAVRGGDRVVELDGCTFLLPTVIHCDDATHPLASTELLFPFVSVVRVDQERMLEAIGPTLVGTAITEDPQFIADLMGAAHIDRLNLGPVSTASISWDQPHEGNLFEHLYRQRAFQGREPLLAARSTASA